MKRKFIISILILLFFILTGCSLSRNDTDSKSSSSDNSIALVSDSKQDMEATIKKLMDYNTDCINNIFLNNSLPTQGRPITENIYQIDALKYKNYQAFNSYIRSIYCKKEADRLLNDSPFKNDPEYKNVGGKLCINISYSAAKGYYVDWKDCRVSIDNLNGNSCLFTVTGVIQEPGETVISQDYSVSSKALKENGKWVLSKIIH